MVAVKIVVRGFIALDYKKKGRLLVVLILLVILVLRLLSIGNYSLKKAKALGEKIELSPQAQVEREIAKELKEKEEEIK